MAVKARLKFKGDMPYALEQKLIQKLGFVVKRRAGREWVEVEKLETTWKPEVLVNGELTEEITNYLIMRCVKIVNYFAEPECHIRVIRTRLNNFSQTLPPFQRKFVHEWMDRNIVEDD